MDSILRNAVKKIETINLVATFRHQIIDIEKELSAIDWDKLYNEYPIIQETLLKEEKKYMDETKFGVKIHSRWIGWDLFSRVSSAVPILKNNINKISWVDLSVNKKFDIISRYISPDIDFIDKLDWVALCGNPGAVEFIESRGMDRICWTSLCANPNAVHLIEKANISDICWKTLAENKNPGVIPIMEANPDKIYWPYLSNNPHAIHLLERNLDKVNWIFLSNNPAAIHLIEKNIDKASTLGLSSNTNPAATEILRKIIQNKNIKYNNM